MTEKSFVGLARQYLGYLIDEYGFAITGQPSGSEPFSDGIIEFRSDTTIVLLRLDRTDVILSLGPAGEPGEARLGIPMVVDYVTHGEKRGYPDYVAVPGSFVGTVEARIAANASALKEYCEPVLRGDFSWWLDALRYAIARIQSDYRSWTGRELPSGVFSGRLKYIEENQHNSKYKPH